MARRDNNPRRLTISIPLPDPRAAGSLAALIVALTVGAAVVGAAAGARDAVESAPPVEQIDAPAAPRQGPALNSVVGRVVGKRDDLIGVRPPGGEPVPVRVLPRTVIRRAGEKVDLAAIERGDRVLVVGRLGEDGVLRARGIVVRRPPPPPAEGAPERPPRPAPGEAGPLRPPKPQPGEAAPPRPPKPAPPSGGPEHPGRPVPPDATSPAPGAGASDTNEASGR